MHPIVIIPARMAANRLPGKPLLEIGGTPMILRVLDLALAADVGPVAVAAGDPEIAWAVEAAGGRAVLTDPDLPSGSDRVRAALAELDPSGAHDVVINLQGDIPFIDPALIRACADLLATEPTCDIATLIAPEGSPAERADPDCPKAIVTVGPDGTTARAHYFTRSTLFGDGPVWRHIGIYGYRRLALERFTTAEPSPLEVREKLEQLRALELGLSIWAAIAPAMPMEVNNEAELAIARAHAERI
jgi:3-deoxy-manno-octulosonate cytidylyltransferase (CMP-KDO synthetase)